MSATRVAVGRPPPGLVSQVPPPLDHSDASSERTGTARALLLTVARTILLADIQLYGRAPFATTPLRDLRASQVKTWYDSLPYGRTTEKLFMVVRAVFTHARSRGWIDRDPTATVERQEVRYSGDYDFYSREEIEALVRAAASEQDAAIYLTAAMTGLRRGELVALRWRDVDFTGQAIRVRANYSFGELVTPKSGKVRSVPMVPDVAQALARLGQRDRFTADDDPVFAGTVGGHLDASALRRRYVAAVKCADLRQLPFHSLRHYFGSMAVNRASLVQVQRGWGTRTSRPPLAISTPRARPATPHSLPALLRRTRQAPRASARRRLRRGRTSMIHNVPTVVTT